MMWLESLIERACTMSERWMGLLFFAHVLEFCSFALNRLCLHKQNNTTLLEVHMSLESLN